MLQCLMVAVRPLRVEELAELLAFEFKAQGVVPKYRTDWRPNDQVEAVLSTCSSLIAIVDDQGSQVVQFSHFSVKEFLMSDRLASSFGDFSQYHILHAPAHTILAQACLGFLLHLDDHADEEMVKGFPFAGYAAKHWVTHAQFEDVASRIKGGMEALFDCDKPHFAAWLGIYNMEESIPESLSKMPTPLYYSSLCGFSDLVEHIAIEHPQQVNSISGRHNFPLLAALVRKHIRVADILLKHGANVNIRGMRERTPLHEAIRDVRMVQSLLKNGAEVNCRQDDLRTPLHLAALFGEVKVATVLAEHKANIDSLDNEGKTPLHLLLEGSSRDNDNILDLARLLLKHGANSNAQQKSKYTPLHTAAFNGRLDVTQVLLDHGANPNTENEGRDTALHLVSRGEYDSQEHGAGIARLLLKHGVDVHLKNTKQDTALLWAASKGRLEITQLLLDHGANPNEENVHGATPLHLVSSGEYKPQEYGVGIAKLLLERGANPNARQKIKYTPLHTAAVHGMFEIVKVLLDHGANPKAETERRDTALHLVSRGKYDSQEHGVGIARLLLKHSVDVHLKNTKQDTALLWAASRGRLEITQLLLDHGANPNEENAHGATPLHLVSSGEYSLQEHGVSIARLLLERGANPNARQKIKYTPLHTAALHGRLEIARVLLDHGADPKAETKGRDTALHLVSRGKYDSQDHGVGIARLLLKHGVDVHLKNTKQDTALLWAASKGRLEITQLLLDHGANPNEENVHGATPLHLVSSGEYNSQEHGVGIARLLLEHGANPNARQKSKYTPLHTAAFNGRLEIAQILLDHGADPKAETEGRDTALHLVSHGEYDSQEHGVGIARLLLKHGVDVHLKNTKQDTALLWAASKGRLEITQLLLDHGANPNEENVHGAAPLHLVSSGEYNSQERGVSIVRVLLEHGANPNARQKIKYTPLHTAAVHGMLEIVQALLDHGANPRAETERRDTALHLVSRGKYDSQEHGVGIARLLLKHGVDVHLKNTKQDTALLWAASKGRLEITQLLLEHGANPNEENVHGATPLHLVSSGEYNSQEHGVGIARLLLEHGANPNARQKSKYTPLHTATLNKKSEIAQVSFFSLSVKKN